MAAKQQRKKKNAPSYSEAVRKLKTDGPERAYLLWGEEDYLRESFLDELRKLCLADGEDDFSFRRFDGAGLNMVKLGEAMDCVPFLSERTFIEVRGFDLNKCRDSDAESLKVLLADVPDYCTVVFVPDAGYEPDGRISAIKSVRKYGTEIEFAAQDQASLIGWIQRRFEARGHKIGRTEASHLIFLSGSLMNGLIMEIEKVAAYAKLEDVSAGDIDAVVTRRTEADVFEMTDKLSKGDADGAFGIAADLLRNKEHPIMLTAIIGQQMRRLYALRTAADEGRGSEFMQDVSGIKNDYILSKELAAARKISAGQLAWAAALCADADYRMKSSGADDEEVFRDLMIQIAGAVK